MDDVLAQMNRRIPPFPRFMGMVFTSIAPDRLVAEVPVREDTSNGGGTMHGGALMAFADTMGAIGTVINLPPGHRTTTLESKTNFIGAAPVGEVLVGECTPMHKGRLTQVWVTRITRANGRLVAVVTQTQVVLPA